MFVMAQHNAIQKALKCGRIRINKNFKEIGPFRLYGEARVKNMVIDILYVLYIFI